MSGIGEIIKPTFIPESAVTTTGQLIGLVKFMNILLSVVFIVAGLYAFINIIIAGFGFMTAGGDSKVIGKSWEKIWQTVLGLLVIVSSFLLAAILGMLLFGSPTAILQPVITP